MMRVAQIAVACGAIMIATADRSAGALILSAADITSPMVVDFSQFPGPFSFTAGPEEVGALVGEKIKYSSTSSDSVIGSADYGLGTNGSWTAARVG